MAQTNTPPLSLQAVNDLYNAWKKQNPENEASLKDFSQRYDGVGGRNLSAGSTAGFLNRKVMQADNLARPAANRLATAIRGGDEPVPFSFGSAMESPVDALKEGTAKGVEMLGGSLPSAAMSLWALSGSNQVRALKTLGALLPYGLISGYNESGDVPHAVTNAVSLAASPVLAQGAVGLAGRAGAGTIGKALAGVGGGMVGDVAEIGAAPTGDPHDSYVGRFKKNLPEFFNDPTNIMSLGVAEAGFGATEGILRATQKRLAAREDRVMRTPGLYTTSGTAVNLKHSLQSEHGLDIPNGVPDTTLRLAAESARLGDTGEAQRKIYASVSDHLTEQQSSRFNDLKKTPAQRLAEYTEKLDRDQKSKTRYDDEIEFEFSTPEDVTNFFSQSAESDTIQKSRTIGKKVFYWGDDDTSIAKLSEFSRAGKVNNMSLRGSNLFSNPAIGVVHRATNPRVVSGGKKTVGAALKPNLEGNYKTESILALLNKQLPKDIVDFYRAELPAFAIKKGYIAKDRLIDAIDKAVPELEVKPLYANSQTNVDPSLEAQHRLEGQGFTFDYSEALESMLITDPDGAQVIPDDISGYQGQNRADIESVMSAAATIDGFQDVATGRYGVEPIPVGDMDRPVDILVRQKGNQKYTGPHFGGSDENVVASVRGYFHDKDTFFAFEVQSDWGQTASKRGTKKQSRSDKLPPGFKEVRDDSKYTPGYWIEDEDGNQIRKWYDQKENPGSRTKEEAYLDAWEEYNKYTIEGSPHLARYERLALQQAIAHAKEGGATRIVLPDAETAMMIEGHDGSFDPTSEGWSVYNLETNKEVDLYVSKEAAEKYKEKGQGVRYVKPSLKQEAGMRTHYGSTGTLRGTLEKLGGKYRGKVDLGPMTNRGPSDYFSGKENSTGFEFDISDVDVADFKMFANLERLTQEKQLIDTETQVKLTRLQQEMLANGKMMSTADFVKRVKSMTALGRSGSDFDVDTMLRAMFRIAGQDKFVSVFNDSRTVDGLATLGFSSDDSNVVGLNLSDATVGEALGTLGHEMTHTSLADYRRSDPEGYQQLEDAVMSISPEQFIGMIDEANRIYGLNLDGEYASGLSFNPGMEDYNFHVAQERMAAVSQIVVGQAVQSKRVNRLVSALPVEVQRFLRNLMDKIRFWFTSDSRYGNYFSKESKAVFDDVYGRLDQQVFQSERAADKLAKIFTADRAFDPTTLGSDALKELTKSSVNTMQLQKDYVNDLTFMEREGMTGAQKNFQSTLSLTKIFPVARPLFESLHNYRNEIQKQLITYFGEMGQNEGQNLPQDQALDKFEKWVHGLALSDPRLDAIGRVFEKMQQQRKGIESLPGETIKDQLVTAEQMKSEFGLSDEDVMMVERLQNLVERVAYQELLDMTHRDYLKQATLLSSLFGGVLGETNSLEIGRNLTMLAGEAAKTELTVRHAERSGDETSVLRARRLMAIKKSELSARLSEELTAAGVKLGEDDPRMALPVKAALMQADYRLQHVLTTSKEGYAPQIRRGKIILRATKPDGGNYTIGFKSKKEATKWWNKQGKELGLTDATVSEKDKLASHYRHYASATLQEIRRQFSSEFTTLVNSFQGEQLSEETQQVLSQMSQQWGDMDAELSDALGQKADPFKLKRNDVAGFKREDYLPNLFDYINVKTIIGRKGITQARAEFEMSKPDFYKNKDLVEQFREITDYTLNSTHKEWSFPRKFVYMYYLGASPRHFFQNITQPFIIGVPELASVTGSFTEAPRRMAAAYKQVAQWNSKGTTGNPALDRIMKQGEDMQVWNTSMLQHYLPTEDLTVGVETTGAYLRGTSGFLKRAKIQSAKANRFVQKALRVTAESSEILNRQIAFAARANEVKPNASIAEMEHLFSESSRFTNDVNFVGDKSNRPGFIRRSGSAHGPLMFATSLMSFVLNHISLQMSYWNQFTKGSVDMKTYKRNPDKFRLDNPGAYGLLVGTAALVAFSGALGLPFSQDADELIEDVTGMRLSDMVRAGIIDLGKQFDLGEEEGDMLTDAVMSGLPGAMGIGMSQSVGLGSIFSFQTGKPFSFWDLLGAGGSIVERGKNAVSAIASDPSDVENWERGVRKALPAGLQYWTELINIVKNNQQLDNEGRVVSNPLDAGAGVSRYLGFTPTKVSRHRATEFRVRRMERAENDKRINLGRQVGRLLFESVATKDTKKLFRAKKEYSDFVRSNKLTVAQRQSLVTSIADDLRARSGQAIDVPSARMSTILSDVQESNPSYQPEVITPMEKRITAARVAQTLGDPIAVKLSTPSSSTIRNQMLYDSLVRSGVNPVVAKMIANKDVESMQQLQGQQLPNLR